MKFKPPNIQPVVYASMVRVCIYVARPHAASNPKEGDARDMRVCNPPYAVLQQ